ncbi:uncharacterized protein LOC122662806 [Telopea speciosissima]|uniref:uncharacterized protein LOC122662806 n=1 Tax=Telopea speciosissima TaxID=54955 RepID=UPI001CC34EE4|nr:uncharacterized protein LOC122662806 [Telopea speciosissima]
MALRAKNKLGFVDGTIPMSDAAATEYARWIRVNDMVASWLLQSITPELAASVIYADSAHTIWAELQNRFSQPNTTKIYQIKQDIADWKQHNLSVIAYFTKLKGLWDELTSYVSLPDCKCGASHKLNAFIQQDYAMKFLQGLHESFAPLRSQVLLQDPLPSIAKLYSLALQEEKQREISSISSTKPEASTLISRGQKGRPHCDHCSMDGHTIHTCYKLHGYPPKKGDASPLILVLIAKGLVTQSDNLLQASWLSSKASIAKSFPVEGFSRLRGHIENTTPPPTLKILPSHDQYAQILTILQQGSTRLV